MRLQDYIISKADSAIGSQQPDGSMPGGSNGPYGDVETSVRNTSHWLSVFSYAYQKTANSKFEFAANNAVDFLLSPHCRPMGASFHCRVNPYKDSCNGLIGQAWAIEGLVSAYKVFNRKDALKVAREVFKMHPFAMRPGLWRRVSVDGSYLDFDHTFNHQLWFAAIGATLNDDEIDVMVKVFMRNIIRHVHLYTDGVIYHRTPLSQWRIYPNWSVSSIASFIRINTSRYRIKKYLYSKSVGYHSFNLYALAILKEQYPHDDIWLSKKLHKILNVTYKPGFREMLSSTEFGWTYNPAGIELAYVGEIFNLSPSCSQEWINMQCNYTYDKSSSDILSYSSPDCFTASARIYEATRLSRQYDISL